MKRLTSIIITLITLLVMTCTMTGCDRKNVITFDATGGVVNSITMVIKTNSEYELPTPVKEGYAFNCWLNGGVEVPNTGKWTVSEDVTLTAKWDVKSYDIGFNANEGEMEDVTLTVTYDKEVELPTPTRKGYSFVGWEYKNKVINGSVWKIDGENIVLNAKWKIIDYTVTFNLNGGQFSDGYENMNSTVVNYGKDYDFKKFKPIRGNSEEWLFKGWVTEDGTPVDQYGNWAFAKDVTLTAVWYDMTEGWFPPV
ncbi:MAG: InlB B-repeat-containing protein [Clostridia bacterium]|nr:InlB B-repeat-containing protein [Clostridia bacterium]